MFFAIAQIFGAFGTHWYGHLIGNGTDRNNLFIGYLVGAGAMILGGIIAIFFGVAAEGKALEDVATPLSVIGKPSEAIFRSGADDTVLNATLPHPRHRGVNPAVTGTEGGGIGSGSVPDPRLGDHDDPSRTRRRPDGGMPLT